MRIVRWAGAVFVSSVLASACGGGGASSEPRDPSSPSVPASDATSLGDVVVVRDEATAVEALIGVEGGVLEVVAGDGTVWTLEVPEGALPRDTLIRAVPAALEGVPFPAWTLMFEPSGLFFYDFATLTIEPPVEVPIDQQFMYALDDEGSAFGAAPVLVDATTPTVLVGHFSGYGLAQATAPERAALLQRQAADAEARIQSDLAEALGELRRAELSGAEAPFDLNELLAMAADEYEREVLRPRLEAAGASCEATTQALQTVIGYERQRLLLGFGESTSVSATEILTAALQPGGPCEEEAIRRCVEAEDPSILLEFWLGRARQLALLGGDPGPSIPDMMRRAKQICTPTSYSVEALWGDFQVSGSICEIGRPFQLDATSSYGSLVMDFTWTDDTSGTIAFTGNVDDAAITGTGSFTIELDDDGGLLSIETAGTATIDGFALPSFVDSTTFEVRPGGTCS